MAFQSSATTVLLLLATASCAKGANLPGCCAWGGSCGAKCGDDGSTWCHEAEANCMGTCGGESYIGNMQPIDNCESQSSSKGCCSYDGGVLCGPKCSTLDGTEWCHESADNCNICSGVFLPENEPLDNCDSWDRSCFLIGYDVGGSENACGYAKEVKVYGGPGYNFSAHSWIAAKNISTEIASFTSAGDCQALCERDSECAYFAFDPTAQGIGRCILKKGYTSYTCLPIYQALTGSVAGPERCDSLCHKVHYDVGGVANACGYAKVVKFYGSPGFDFSSFPWLAEQGVPTESVGSQGELDEIADCQGLCGLTLGCDYFVFDFACQKGSCCTLKESYDNASCAPLYEPFIGQMAGPVMCLDAGSHKCNLHGYDVGGSANSCGYAPELKVYGGPGYNFSQNSWIDAKNIPYQHVSNVEELDESGDCQKLCSQMSNCAYFVYSPTEQKKGRCILKGAYSEVTCTPLYQGASSYIAGPSNCSLDCKKEDQDYGGDFNSCGFAKEVKVFAGFGYNFSKDSWIASKGIPVEHVNHLMQLDEPADCQSLCGATQGCSYFVFDASAQNISRCILKAAYSEATCTPLYAQLNGSLAGPVTCSLAPVPPTDNGGKGAGVSEVSAAPSQVLVAWVAGALSISSLQ